MNQANKLLTIKLIHTVIWAFFVTVIFYILYAGITNTITRYTWIGIGLIIGEGLVLLVFKMYCPLTVIARNYSDSQKDNFDIFLPNWLARYKQYGDSFATAPNSHPPKLLSALRSTAPRASSRRRLHYLVSDRFAAHSTLLPPERVRGYELQRR